MLNCLNYRLFVIVVGLLATCFIASCEYSSRNASSGVRGGTIMVLRIIDEKKDVDLISVNEDKHAIRAGEDEKDSRTYSDVILPDDLYANLDNMRKKWCKNSPGSEIVSEGLSTYEIAIECNRIVNPDFMLLPNNLPEPIEQLINAVPLPLSPDTANS